MILACFSADCQGSQCKEAKEMERITRQNVETRVENVNRRMESFGSTIRYVAEARNGHIGLDRVTRDLSNSFGMSLPDSVPGRGAGWITQSTVTVGTKREVADFLHAMMVALDDSKA
jgi:hypothetical protein